MYYDDFRERFHKAFDLLLDNVAITKVYERMLEKGWNYKLYNPLFFNRQYDYERLHPTEEMRESENYFKEHGKDIDVCRNLLADDLSRVVYTQAIMFRYTHNRSDLPPYDVSDQYFPNDIIRLSDGEVFIDCGACRGDTYRRFIRESKNKYKRVICIEPDEDNCRFIEKSSLGDTKLLLVQKAVWSENTTLSFLKQGSAWNGTVTDGQFTTSDVEMISTCSIDTIEECADATFIKMDIEGSELEALKGAAATIRANHPKLAICIYHKPEDYISIINYIHALNPNYKLFVRHHAPGWYETVLYAIE